MANLEIQGIDVKFETSKYTEYRIEIHLKTPETDEGMIDTADFYLAEPNSRSDLTFDRIEEIVNEKLEDMDIEVLEISNIEVKEVTKFKKSVYQDGENYK
jgi:hypothetical protein